MSNIIKGLVILAALAFVLAVIGALININILKIPPEGYSRACSNLALIAIATAFGFKSE
jgi:hypothetical protein